MSIFVFEPKQLQKGRKNDFYKLFSAKKRIFYKLFLKKNKELLRVYFPKIPTKRNPYNKLDLLTKYQYDSHLVLANLNKYLI